MDLRDVEDRVNDLLGYLERLAVAAERIADVLDDASVGGRLNVRTVDVKYGEVHGGS